MRGKISFGYRKKTYTNKNQQMERASESPSANYSSFHPPVNAAAAASSFPSPSSGDFLSFSLTMTKPIEKPALPPFLHARAPPLLQTTPSSSRWYHHYHKQSLLLFFPLRAGQTKNFFTTTRPPLPRRHFPPLKIEN